MTAARLGHVRESENAIGKKMGRRFCCEEKTLKSESECDMMISERECYGVTTDIGLQIRCRCRSIRSSHGAITSSMVLFAIDTWT